MDGVTEATFWWETLQPHITDLHKGSTEWAGWNKSVWRVTAAKLWLPQIVMSATDW